MTKDLKNDRWTCPNDRNLQLRSKLNAGWSIHTGKKTLKKDPQLTESELIEIQKVLQRSELLERNEKDRVMKLVDRLENMKRNANQSQSNLSPNRCALCGDYFCLIRTAPNQCSYCQKILCNKCCIDTECTVDNDTSSNPSQSRRNSSSSLSKTTSYIGSSNSNKVVVYLCRICSEQREFLKKSGAWFMKKYPNYVSNGVKYNSTSNISQVDKTPPEQKMASFASPFMLKRNISTSSSNSATFRFWKFKENVQNYVNDISDNVSDFSNENDRNELDLNSNYDTNSFINRTGSSENFNNKTPSSPNKKQENFFFGNNNYQTINSHNNNDENNSPLSIFNLKSNINGNDSPLSTSSLNKNINNVNMTDTNTSTSINNKNSVLDKKNYNFSLLSNNSINSNQNNNNNQTKKLASESNSNHISFANQNHNQKLEMNKPKVKDILLSDDEPSSPNMSSYNYYSNIITNLNPNQTGNNNKFLNSTSFKDKSSSNSNLVEDLSKKIEPVTVKTNHVNYNNNYINNNTKIRINNSKENENIGIRTKKLSVSSLTDEILNNSLSASASNLDSNVSNINSQLLSTKTNTNDKSLKKNRLSEWCSTQLSLDDENYENDFKKKTFKPVKSKQFANIYTSTGSVINNAGINNIYKENFSNKPKISSQTVNNLAKKIANQNNSILPVNSLSVSSSSALSSASSLTASLAKLSFK